MPAVLVTGASRGIGLEFVRQFSADGWRVIAGCRQPQGAAELAKLAAGSAGRVTVHPLDVLEHAGIDRLSAQLAQTPLDVLINNAGVGGQQKFGEANYALWLETFRVNTLGPMKVAEAFAKQVAAGGEKKIVTLTSVMGSIGQNNLGGMYGYRSTKAAANAVMRSMAIDLKRLGIIAIAMHPGWVKTDMGGPQAQIDVATSVGGMRRVIAGLKREDSGSFLGYDGKQLPW
ncbi:MAG TPA: SDR family oxidoreductase [Steroidobacteraceae bacterium]|nr:SDR family oxidoreductase [Steroidobacteraceae bacterium]